MKRKAIIIDTHTHIGYWPTLSKTQNDLIASNRDFNISYSLVSFDGTEFKDNSNRRGKLVSQLEASKKCLKFVKENRHFGMLVWIRPHLEKNYEEIEQFIVKHREYIHGLKFHPYCSRLRVSDPRLLPYIGIARKYNLPILVHTASDTYSKIKYLEKVASLNPDITFIAAHLELETDNQNALRALKANPNLYGDTAWVNIETIQKAKEIGVLDKIMFGTDNPIDGYETLNNPIYQSYFNNDIKLKKKEYDNLMYKLAMKIYNIKKEELD